MLNLTEHPHKRYNLLTGEWVLVSPHRTKRPWQGKQEAVPADTRPSYDPKCYLCPGNKRADGDVNPQYSEPFAFTNDFSALLADTPQGTYEVDGLLKAQSEMGICRVISFSPDHSSTLPVMPVVEIEKVIKLWQKEVLTLSENENIKYIQIFENKGDIMGCSNPHPHGQIWASSSIPNELQKETFEQKKYFDIHSRSLLGDYLKTELDINERIILENEHFVALVPFWAIWPYETIIISKRHVNSINAFSEIEVTSLATILKQLTIKYDNLFDISFPYSAGIHQAPVNDGTHEEWHWHIHFYPPLLRSATVKKFMVGYEMLANPQRDISPEAAAKTLKNLSIRVANANRDSK
jgi:UDPglucose--hexose-1-phosphate uridylyltransferase